MCFSTLSTAFPWLFLFQNRDIFLQTSFTNKDNEKSPRLVNQTCTNMDICQETFSPDMLKSIIVNDKYKFLFCSVPKVGSTSWKRVIRALNEGLNGTTMNEIPGAQVHNMTFYVTLNTLSKDEIQHRLKNYFKFMFVREPLERLVSAYKNKFTLRYNTYFQERFGRKIIKNHRKNPSKESLLRGHDVTFSEFVQYLLTSYENGDLLNAHWQHYYKLCHPCLIKYDFIGKYETFMEDAELILKLLNVNNLIRMPTRTTLTNTNVVQQTYRNITSEQIHKLWQMYSVDFAMFGYPYQDIDL